MLSNYLTTNFPAREQNTFLLILYLDPFYGISKLIVYT